MKSKASIVASGIFARVRIVLGALFALFAALMLITAFATDALKDNSSAAAVIIFFIFVLAGGIVLLVNGIKTVKRIFRFRRYVSLISKMNIHSIIEISRQMSQQPDFTLKDLTVMIQRQYFTSAYIDAGADKIIIHQAVPPQSSSAAQNIPASRNMGHGQENPSAPPSSVPPQPISVNCRGCGAVNTITAGQSINCEYCGSLIK